MKSPLVDALRLASGQDKAANNESAETEPTTPAPEAGQDPELGPNLLDPGAVAGQELSLLDATGAMVVQTADEEEDEFATSQVIAEEAVNEVIDEPPAPPPAVVTASHGGRRDGLARLGMYSPLLCLLMASAATGSYFLYQSAGGNLQSTGLGMLSPVLGTTDSSAMPQQAEMPINRFPLIGDSRRSRPAGRPSTALRTNATPAVNVPQRAPATTVVRSGIDDRAFAALNEGYAAYEAGDFRTAEAAYRRALEIAPRHPNGLHGLAAILHRSGKVEEALGYYEALLSVDPENTEAAAALLAGNGGSAGAANEAEMKVLLQRHPRSAHLHDALGTFMAQRGRWAEARRAYYEALAIDPQNPEYQFNLAVSLENLGQYDDARARYEAVLASVTDASTIDSELVVARISMLARRSGDPGAVQ